MKKSYLFVAMIFFIVNTLFAEQPTKIYHDSSLVIDGKTTNFSYLRDTVREKDWFFTTISDMRTKMGAADWYMITYSGGNISLIHQVGQGYESYDLVTASVKEIDYKNYFLISLKLIELKVKSGQSIIIADSQEALKKIIIHESSKKTSPRLETIRLTEELAKFQKR